MSLTPSKFYFAVSIVCLLLSGLVHWLDSNQISEVVAQAYVQNNVDDALEKQAAYVEDFIENYSTGSYKISGKLSGAFPTFIFQNGTLKSWSDYQFIPDYLDLDGDYQLKMIRTEDGVFLSKRRILTNSPKVEVFSLVVLQRDYSIENEYVRSGLLKGLFPFDVEITEHSEDYKVGYRDEILFRLSFPEDFQWSQGILIPLSSFLLFMGVVLLVLSLFLFAERLAAQASFTKGALALFLGLIALRWCMMNENMPLGVWPGEAFDSSFYYSSHLIPSLADLFLHVVALGILTLFLIRNYDKSELNRLLERDNIWSAWLARYVILSIPLAVLLGHFELVETLAFDSQVSIDITESLVLSLHRLIIYGSFLAAAFIFFCIQHLTLHLVSRKTNRRSILLIQVLTYIWLIPILQDKDSLLVIIAAHFSFIALCVAFQWYGSLDRLRYASLLYLFSSGAVSAILLSWYIYKASELKVVEEKNRFANQLILGNDVVAEYLLSQTRERLEADTQLKSRFLNPKLLTDQVELNIRSQLNSYFDKYHSQIYFFGSDGESMAQSPDIRSIDDLIDLETLSQNRTEYSGLYYFNRLGDRTNSRYILLVPMTRYDSYLGELVMVFRLKKSAPNSVFPKLLVDRKWLFTPDAPFSYAIYNKGRLEFESGEFDYGLGFQEEWVNLDQFYKIGIEFHGYHHLGVRGSEDKFYVISSPTYRESDVLANFSFLFFLIILLVVILTLITTVVRSGSFQLNFATKLQLYLSVTFFIPLLITSIVVLQSINSAYRQDINDKYKQNAELISDVISEKTESFLEAKINRSQLAREVAEIARYSQNDLSIFDAEGQLLVSSQPAVYESRLISDHLNPLAYYQIVAGEQDSFVIDEQIGELVYRSAYHALRAPDDGKLLGMIGIPYFGSAETLERDQLEVFGTILNIFSVIFIITLIVTYLATSVLTRPLRLIASKLRKTDLEGTNTPLEWSTSDEIGILIAEYNRMLVNLEKSRENLAKNQKELAWREMAKQVAHEIKNPLTPMKLTLQQMQRSLFGRGHSSEQTDRSINTVLNQIDTLSDIATSFSAFAKMPLPENVRMDLKRVAEETVGLFEEKCNIEIHLVSTPVWIYADPRLMGRILNNLILNGIQAVPEGKEPLVKVTLARNDDRAKVTVTDNGKGIDEKIAEKIFTPNFTTKSSGSGLGLAIAKRGIEHVGGRLWYESEVGIGTSFFIELPLFDE